MSSELETAIRNELQSLSHEQDSSDVLGAFEAQEPHNLDGARIDGNRSWLAASLWCRDADSDVPTSLLRHCMHVVELLARVYVVDAECWKAVSSEFADGDRDRVALPRVFFDVNLPFTAPETALSVLQALLGGVSQRNEDLWSHLQERDVVKELIEAQERQLAKPVHHVVELGFSFRSGQITSAFLFQLVEMLEQFGETQQRRHEAAVARGDVVSVEFRVVALFFNMNCEIPSVVLRSLGELLTRSRHMHVESIAFRNLQDYERSSLQLCLRDLTAPRKNENGGAQLKQLQLQAMFPSTGVVESAVRYNSSLEHVEWKLGPKSTVASAAWLAFGLFHRDSSSQVSSISVGIPSGKILTPEWIETFKRVLNAVVSAPDLAPLDRKLAEKLSNSKSGDSPHDEIPLPSDKRVFVTVHPRTKARSQPQPRSTVVAELGGAEDDDGNEDEGEKAELMQFQVIRRLRDWVALAVPSAGPGWIPATAIASEVEAPTQVAPASEAITNRRVRSIAWMLTESTSSDSALDVIIGLLEPIGDSLEALHIPGAGMSRPDHVEQILRACPNLSVLNLVRNHIADLTPLVEAYNTGTCKVKELNINQWVEAPAVIVRQAIEIMAKRVVRSLQIRVSPWPRNDEDFDPTEITQQLNQTLLNDSIVEDVAVELDEADEDCVSGILEDPFSSDMLVHVPLPLRAKLAFLSSLDQISKTKNVSSELDASPLGLVFRFASSTQPKSVRTVVLQGFQ